MNKFSVTSAGLGEGLARSASALQLAGNTFEESAAMIGAVTEVTQDPEKAGSAMKILSLRLRGMKGQLEELGEETDENVENISKMQGQILNMTKGQVNIFDDAGDFRSTYDIMVDIAKVYDELSSVDQANLLETIAGKHRANDVAALIQNIGNAMAMEESAMNSAGSAAKENARTVDSLQGRINSLTATWQDFANTVMESDFLKGLVSIATGFLDVITKIIDSAGSIGTIMAAFAGILSFTDFKSFLPLSVEVDKSVGKITDQLRIFGTSIEDVKKSWNSMGSMKELSLSEMLGDDVLSLDDISLSDDLKKKLDNDLDVLDDFVNGRTEDIKKGSLGLQEAFDATNLYDADGVLNVGAYKDLQAEIEKTHKMQEVANKATSKSFKDNATAINAFNSMGIEDQKRLAAEISKTDAAAGKYFNNTIKGGKAGKASMMGMVAATGAARLATIGLQLAVMAFEAAATLGITLAIQGIITLCDKLITTKEEYAEMAQEALDAFKDQKSAADNAKKTVNELGESYAKLSKGVNSVTGENVSLSTSEYEEYLNVTNQIAEAMPSLIKGYDSQGNAILSCTGDVNALTEAYKEMQKAANDALLNDAGSVFETFKNDATKLTGKGWKDSWLWDFDADMDMESYQVLSDLSSNLSDANLEMQATLSNLSEYAGATGILLNNATGGLSSAASAATYDFADSYHEIATAFSKLGYEQNLFETNGDFVARVLKEDPNVAQKTLKAFEATIEPVADGMRDIAGAHISNAFLSGDYGNISSSMQTMIESMVPNLSFDFFNDFIGADGTFNTMGFYAELDSIMETFNSLDPFQEKQFKVFMDLQTQYNSGEISAGEYFSNIEDMNSLISTLDPEVQESIKIVLGLDDASVNEVKQDYNSLVNDLVNSGMTEDAAKEFANSLTSAELTAAVELVASGDINLEGINLEKFRAEIEHITNLKEAMNFTIDVEAETESIDSLNTALDETVSATGLTTESIEKLKGRYSELESFDASALFERTASGMRLNYEELSRLEKEYAEFNQQNTDEALDTLVKEYNDLTSEIDSCSDATEKQNLLNEQSEIANKIEEVYNLSSAYDALTSSVNDYLNSQTTEEATSLYSQIGTDYDTVENDLKDGWFSDADKKYIQMFSFEDLSGASKSEYLKVFNEIDDKIAGTSYSLKDMWKFDDDGNIKTDGLENFLKATQQLNSEWANFDKTTGEWTLDFNVEEMAKEFGVSTSLIEMFIQQLETSLGFEVNYDSIAEQLGMIESEFEGIVEEAKNANDALKDFGLTETTFSFETTDIDSLTSDLDEALGILDKFRDPVTGKIDMDKKGAEEALTVCQTLTSLIDNLGNAEPAYLKLDASQVDDDIQQPLESLKKYDELVEKKHQLQLEGADVSDIDAQLLEIATSLSNLGKETKIKLGIDGMTPEEIRQKIESGEINIDGTVNLEANMDESLSQMVDLMMVEHGFMSKSEFEAKWIVDVNAEAGEVDDSSFWDKAKSWWNETFSGGESESVEVEADVDVKSGEVDTSDVENKTEEAVENVGLIGNAVKTSVDTIVETDNVDTSDVDNKVEEAVEGIGNETSELETSVDLDVKIDEYNELVDKLEEYKSLVDSLESPDLDIKIDEYNELIQNLEAADEKSIGLEVKIDEYNELIQNLEDADKDIEINVEVNGIDQVKELNKEINLATNIEGSVANLTEFVEGAKALSELDSNIVANVTANVFGNVTDEFEYRLNNIEVFAESAKELQGVDSFSSNITANVFGNVIDTEEYKLNNLGIFAENIAELEDIGSISSNVTANIDGNVTGKNEFQIDNLKVFYDSAKDLKDIGSFTSKVTANVEGNVTDKNEFQIDNLKVFSDSAKELKEIGSFNAIVTANVEGNVTSKNEFQIDNLKTFSDSSKELKDIGSFESVITASVEGNVTGKNEYQIDNLKVFSDSAKELKEIGSPEAKVTANIEGNVTGKNEYQIDNLKVFHDSAKDLSGFGEVTAKITADVEGNVTDKNEFQIDNLKVFYDSAKDLKDIGGDVTAKVTADVEGNITGKNEYQIDNLKVFYDSAKDLKNIGGDVNAKVTANVEGNITDKNEYQIDNLKVFYDSAKDLKDIGEDVKAKVTADVEGNITGKNEFQIDNLKVFYDSAKDLKNIGEDVKAKVTANVEGNITDKNEYQIDNLKVFHDSAKDLKDIGEDVKAKVTANIEGDVTETNEYKIDNLKVFYDSAKGIKELEGEITSTVTANVGGSALDTKEDKIDNIRTFIDSATGIKELEGEITTTVTANLEGTLMNYTSLDSLMQFAQCAKELQGVEVGEVTIKATGGYEWTGSLDDLIQFTQCAKDLQGVTGSNVDVTASATLTGIDDATITKLQNFGTVVSMLNSVSSPTISVIVNVDSAAVESAIASVNNLAANSGLFRDYTATVTVSVNSSAYDSYSPAGKTGTVTLEVDSSKIDSYTVPPKTGTITYNPVVKALTELQRNKTGTIWYTPKISGTGPAAGTAHSGGSAVSGRAFARGDWGIKGSGVALAGELGAEVVVRDGRFFTVGDNGAEFFKYQPNDII